MDNSTVAQRLDEIASLLEEQRANRFRVQAYRRAAATVRQLGRPLDAVLRDGGRAALCELPGIGPGIAATIEELVLHGRSGLLERLRGAVEPETLFASLPGIGRTLARRIYEHLHVESLEALELAAHNGRLESVPGIGRGRVEAIRAVLAERLGRGPRATLPVDGARPSVATVLEVDRRYREDAEAGRLPLIAPRRFNPTGRAWLPIGHYELDGWHFTALYSNTARAHRLRRTKDWVVIFFHDDQHREAQHTVVTETRGRLAGRRVVRGREAECLAYYRALAGHHSNQPPPGAGRSTGSATGSSPRGAHR